MHKIGRYFLKLATSIGLSFAAALLFATLVALRHKITTPLPLKSSLPGDDHLYRWHYGHIFYKTLGDRNAPPLLLLHTPSIDGSAHEMRYIAEALAQNYYVYAPDLPGFGFSDRLHIDYSAETYISLCHDFLTEVMGKPAFVLASMLSCNYAVIVAQEHPDLCSHLILISPTELFDASSNPSSSTSSGNERQASLLTRIVQIPIVQFFLYPLLTTRTTLRLTLAWQRPGTDTADIHYRYATTHQFGAELAPMALLAGKLAVDSTQQFDALKQPTLIIWGARALNNTRIHTHSIGRSDTTSYTEVVLIQDAGLYIHEEYPTMVLANIREWLEAEHPAKAGKIEASGESEEPDKGQAAQGVQETPVSESVQIPAVEAYCARCKTKTIMQNPQAVTMKNGRPALKGSCSVCGTGQYRIA
jgi:pimeloyl-ACP methyl ester carboxylesterase